MKKLYLKFAAQQMTKEQMKRILGGVELNCTIQCCNDIGYIGTVTAGNCSDGDELCANAGGGFEGFDPYECDATETNGPSCSCSN